MLLNSKYNKIIRILKNNGVGVMPTDTLYGLVGSVFSKKAVDRIYRIKNRDKRKPLIILISSFSDLRKIDLKIDKQQAKILEKFWPGKVSIILPCASSRLKYLHRGTKSLAIRFPKNKFLLKILEKTGPLVAPSANPEGLKPAKNITGAKKYFKDEVDFYLSNGTYNNRKPSNLIKITNDGEIIVLRGKLK